MSYSKRDMIKIIKNNGYVLIPHRGKGSHMIYKKDNRVISLGNSFNQMVFQRIIKEYNLAV